MRALVGHTGFVGTNLKAATSFDALYSSRTIEDIRGRSFDLLVCAAAPATMWAANRDPEGDLANLRGLIDHLASARIGRLVLVSTIAVLADAAGGLDETTDAFETRTAYGRNRRLLEVELTARFPKVHVLRLPALYGIGLKKNFIFDLLNPVPSFLKPDVFQDLVSRMPGDAGALAARFFGEDAGLGMMRFAREQAAAEGAAAALDAAFAAAGFTAARFTNSESRFQYYGLNRLWGDIERSIALGLPVLHLASAPLKAGDLHLALTGQAFVNDGPAVYREDMHSRHAAAWNEAGPYLYSGAETLADLRRFFAQERG